VRAFWRNSLRMSPVNTRRSGCIRWLASGDPASLRSSLRTGPVCTRRVRCDAVEHPVVLCRRACAVAVGGNGRVQTASDTWVTLEHRTLGVERRWLPMSVWCPRVLPSEGAMASLALEAINRSGGRPWLGLSTLGT